MGAMKAQTEAYLDIETTGLSPFCDYITVIGIYLCNSKDDRLVQMVSVVSRALARFSPVTCSPTS